MAALCLPIVALVAHPKFQKFQGYDREEILSFQVCDPEKAMATLIAERKGTLSSVGREMINELRARNLYPCGWEVEIRKTNWSKFACAVVVAESALIILIQGSTSVAAWVANGFIRDS